jgi:hypothetical protein
MYVLYLTQLNLPAVLMAMVTGMATVTVMAMGMDMVTGITKKIRKREV